jgi:hypothetical protein
MAAALCAGTVPIVQPSISVIRALIGLYLSSSLQSLLKRRTKNATKDTGQLSCHGSMANP